MIIVHACAMIIVYAFAMIIVHPCTIIVVHVSCPARIMFRQIEDGGSSGQAPWESSEVQGAAGPQWCMYYDHGTCMYYGHIACMYYEHCTCMYYDHVACMYYDHSTCMYYGHITCMYYDYYMRQLFFSSRSITSPRGGREGEVQGA